MSIEYVENASELYSAISNAQPGYTIVLRDGDYGSLDLTGISFSDYVTIRSENPQGALFESVSLNDSHFVRIDGIHVDSSSNGAAASTLVSVTDGSSNIDFRNSEVNGLVDNFYYGHYGLYTQNVSDVTFSNNYIHDVKIGGTFYTAENLTVSGNTVDYIGADSFKFISVDGVEIEDNMGARHVYPDPGEHNDFIQFQGSDSTDIVIRGNVSLPGTIGSAQGIFLDDAHYTNVLIEDNVIVTSMIRGVSVSSGTNVVARDNTLINLEGEGSKATKVLVDGESYNNIMVSYAADASVGTNLTLQNQDPNAPLYYGDYFANPDAGRWIQLEDLLPEDGTLAETYGATETIERILNGDFTYSSDSLSEAAIETTADPVVDGSGIDSGSTADSETTATTLAAAPAQAVWGFSGSLEVLSAEDVVEAPHSEFLSLESGTIAFTFNADSISGRQGLFTKDASYYGGGGNHFSAYLDNGELVVRFQDGASDKIFSLNGISPNQDYGLHVTFGDGQVSAMLDGVEFGAAAFDMNWQENAEHIQVGALGWGSASGQSGFSHIFDGTISEVAIFSENLTPSQADEAFQGTITPDGITETTEGSSNAAADGTTEEPQSEATGSTIDEGNSTDADTSDSGAPYEGSNPLDQSALDESLIWELASQEISGASDVVELAHFAEMEMSEGTIALSFNADELSGRQGLISKDASYYEGGGNHFAAYLEKDLLTIRFQNGDSDQVFTVEGISANQDYDLHIGFRDGSVSAWLDGELINSADFTMNWEQNIQHLQVGALGWASDSGEAGFRDVFKGTISDVLIIDGMLTPEELASAASGDFLEPIGESETEATQTIGTSTLVASDPLLEWIVHSMSDVSTETTLEEIPSDEYDEETSLMWTE